MWVSRGIALYPQNGGQAAVVDAWAVHGIWWIPETRVGSPVATHLLTYLNLPVSSLAPDSNWIPVTGTTFCIMVQNCQSSTKVTHFTNTLTVAMKSSGIHKVCMLWSPWLTQKKAKWPRFNGRLLVSTQTNDCKSLPVDLGLLMYSYCWVCNHLINVKRKILWVQEDLPEWGKTAAQQLFPPVNSHCRLKQCKIVRKGFLLQPINSHALWTKSWLQPSTANDWVMKFDMGRSVFLGQRYGHAFVKPYNTHSYKFKAVACHYDRVPKFNTWRKTFSNFSKSDMKNFRRLNCSF